MEALPSTYDPLQADLLTQRLGRSLFASNIIFQEKVTSTNTLAKELAACGAPNGTVVLAEEQTAGKGRMGRKWLSPPRANLLFSLLLRPPVHLEEVFRLTVVLALSAIAGVYNTCGLNPMIKWPNDLYASGKKLGGMLTEFSARGKCLDHVILGLGLNVNWNPGWEKLARYQATSIVSETRKKVSREDLLVHTLRTFESYYIDVLGGNFKRYYEQWNERSMLRGRRVELITPTERICGKALRIERNGTLILLDDQGQERKILSGEVSVGEIEDEGFDERMVSKR
jgi:BirA family biotin operon repressor/biotin-[acetyl-CoA-carboxylase] ligase